MNLGQRNAVVVAHPDDESLWCGGLLARYSKLTDFTVFCCSIPIHDPVRAFHFFDACKVLGVEGRILPFVEQTRLTGLSHISLLDYDCVITHGPRGEYGHQHHKQVSEYCTIAWGGDHRPVYTFCYDRSDRAAEGVIRLQLTAHEAATKRKAIFSYCTEDRVGSTTITKGAHLLKRYGDRLLEEECYARAK